MIKECFQDDENKCKELLTMISESIFQKNLEGLTYKERAEIEMNDLNQRLELRDHQVELRNHQLEQKDQQIVQITQQKDQQIKRAENENNELRKEIEQLKKQLSN